MEPERTDPEHPEGPAVAGPAARRPAPAVRFLTWLSGVAFALFVGVGLGMLLTSADRPFQMALRAVLFVAVGALVATIALAALSKLMRFRLGAEIEGLAARIGRSLDSPDVHLRHVMSAPDVRRSLKQVAASTFAWLGLVSSVGIALAVVTNLTLMATLAATLLQVRRLDDQNRILRDDLRVTSLQNGSTLGEIALELEAAVTVLRPVEQAFREPLAPMQGDDWEFFCELAGVRRLDEPDEFCRVEMTASDSVDAIVERMHMTWTTGEMRRAGLERRSYMGIGEPLELEVIEESFAKCAPYASVEHFRGALVLMMLADDSETPSSRMLLSAFSLQAVLSDEALEVRDAPRDPASAWATFEFVHNSAHQELVVDGIRACRRRAQALRNTSADLTAAGLLADSI